MRTPLAFGQSTQPCRTISRIAVPRKAWDKIDWLPDFIRPCVSTGDLRLAGQRPNLFEIQNKVLQPIPLSVSSVGARREAKTKG